MAKITIETDDISEARSLLDALETRTAAPAATATPAPTPSPAPATSGRSEEAELDANGMPWDEEIHTSTKAQNADGTWKARKGKADEAKAAAAAFKAGGGNEEPPADLPATPPMTAAPVAGMPTASAPAATTGMPTAGMPAARAPEPEVTQDVIEAKITGMLGRGTLVNDAAGNHAIGQAPAGTFQALLDQFGIDRADPVTALSSNATLRSQVYTACCQIEPEAP